MTPVVLGLALAITLASLTARRSAGVAFARAGLLGTPEERNMLPVIAAFTAAAPHFVPPADPVRALFADREFMAAHRAMLPPPRQPGEPYDPALLIARAKLDDTGAFADAIALLTKSELAAALANALCLDRLAALSPGVC